MSKKSVQEQYESKWNSIWEGYECEKESISESFDAEVFDEVSWPLFIGRVITSVICSHFISGYKQQELINRLEKAKDFVPSN